jgi:hypothetical protein
MLARPVPGLAAFLQVHLQASLRMVLQKLRFIRSANDQLLAYGRGQWQGAGGWGRRSEVRGRRTDSDREQCFDWSLSYDFDTWA